MLQGKHILLGITGGIAAYKIPELIRLLLKQGADVHVVTTKNALQFVTPLTLETLSNHQVYSDVFATHNEHNTEHISLPDWADLMIIAPCTANVIGKMANGIADDALTTTFLAMQKPVLIAPAMNDKMYTHPAVQNNLATLQGFENVTVLDCAEGQLACGTTGKGRMQEITHILAEADGILEEKTLQGKHILITAGPTQEKIDPVRFISNYSTGKMGYALADICIKKGATVTLITGPTALNYQLSTLNKTSSAQLSTIPVTSAEQMYEAAVEHFAEADIAILCAAVADFTVPQTAEEKIKRGKDDWNLTLVPTKDIAAELGRRKTSQQVLVGFALETQNEEANAQQKMEKKNLDYIVLNSLRNEGAGFGYDTNQVTIFSRTGTSQQFPLKSKHNVARDIISCIIS